MSTDVTALLDEADGMMSGEGDSNPQAGTTLTKMLSSSDNAPETPSIPGSSLFSTYFVSPTYFSQIPANVDSEGLLLIKLVSAKGEPFFIVDPTSILRPLVCGNTEVFLTPYDADTACVDECEGLPALHLVPEEMAARLFSMATKGLCTERWFAGLVFISNVGMQFYYREGGISPPVQRVAEDKDGHITAREVKGAVTCDYPVPYLLINQCIFSEGVHTLALIESLPQANISLIDSLCKLQYHHLHVAEDFPEDLDSSIHEFMGTHSHLVKGLLVLQMKGAECDDAFVRRQRKNEIDTNIRLMMREVELIDQLKKIMEELAYVYKTVRQQVPCGPPLPAVTMQDLENKSSNIIGHDVEISGIDDMLSEPMITKDQEDDSGSECSR